MISDDIAKLFETDPSEPTPMSLRQGVLQAWDPSTADNEVLVGGGLLVNVPVLTSESTSLTVGDVVSLLITEDRALLVGRVTTPGDPGTVPTWPTDIIALDQSVTTLNTVTIPAVQATVLVAQGTADTAQSTADVAAADAAAAVADASTALSKFPITETDITDGAISTPKLAADAIDGIVITGSTLRTAASGRRVEINSSPDNRIRFYSGDASEVTSGTLNTSGTDLNLTGPILGSISNPTGSIALSPTAGPGTTALASLLAIQGQIMLDTTDAVLSVGIVDDTPPGDTPGIRMIGDVATFNGVDIATVSDTQALTNKNLTGAGNTFPTSLATLTGTQTLTNKDLTASTNTFPGQMLTQVLSAAMTGGAVTVPTTEADITGATVTFSTAKTNARYAVTASFYFGANTGGIGVATGKLSIDGTNQAAQANFTGATTLDRANVGQSWTGTLAATGSHTFKLRHVMSSAGGTFGTNPTHTALTVQIFE